MKESRTNFYYLEGAGNFLALERSVAKISGVLSVKVDEEKCTLEYSIDEWSSDYDILTEVMRLCSESGFALDFSRQDEEGEELNEQVAEVEENILPDEVEEAESQESSEKSTKNKKGLSERWQRVIELGVSIVAFIVSLFLEDIAQYIFLALGFAIAGYDALYEAIVKITKKQIFSEELLMSLAFFASILLGYAEYGVGALLLYSVVAFARKTIREEIEKNPAFAKNDQTVTKYSEKGIEKVEESAIVVGDELLILQNTVSPFDGAVDGECVVEDFKGVTREISAGDQIYAGERVLTEVKICVTAIGEDCKFGKYNQYINRAASNASPLAEKINKYSQFIYLGVFALCLIVAFLLPVFESSYTYGLAKWGYVAVIIAAVSGLGFFTFASEINLLSLLARGRKCKLGFSGYNAIMNLAKADGVFLDYESVLVDENGELKADSCGAVREIKDTKIKDLSIVCSLDDDKAETVCKTLKIKEYYSRSSQEEKNLELKKAVESGKAVATSCDNYSAIANEKGAVVCFDCEKLGYNGDACLSSDEIAYLPYAIKLAKRTAKIQKINLIIGFGIKALIVLLAVLGIAELWWAVLADSLVSIICALNAFLSSKEVY